MPLQNITEYHAHLYYEDQAGLETAQCVAAELAARMAVKVGRFHQKKVGPHPKWSVQVAFPASLFEQVIPWLMLHRQNLDVFFHPLTGDALWDHTQGAAWLGQSYPLDIRQFLPKN